MDTLEFSPLPFAELEQLAISSDRLPAGEGWFRWRDTERLTLAPPSDFGNVHLLSPATRLTLNRPLRLDLPPLDYILLEGGAIGGKMMPISATGRVVREALPPHELAFAINEGLVEDNGIGVSGSVAFESVRHIAGTTLVLPVSATSMSHFIFEGLVHLGLPLDSIDNIVILTNRVDEYASLVNLGESRKIPVLFRHNETWTELWRCDRLIIPKYIFNLHPTMAGKLSRIADEVRPASGVSPFLYISRRDSSRYRMMLNEDEVEEVMTALGFDILLLAEMEEGDIVRRFGSAKFIVGPMGAGLYNAIYAPADAFVLALNSPNYLRSLLAQSCAIKGQPYGFYLGPDFLSYEPLEQQGGHNDFVVDAPGLKRFVLDLMRRRLTA